MLPDRKWMWIRLTVWVVILGYVILMLSEPKLSDAVGQAALEATGLAVLEKQLPLVAPPGVTTPAALPGDAASGLEALQAALTSCPAPGVTVRLVLGPQGLERASAEGQVPACLAGALWSAAWPSLAAPLELELSG